MKSARKPFVLLAAAVALGLLVSGSLAAEVRKVDQTVKADKDGLVIVENIAGSIRIEAWDKNEVKITGTLGKDVEDLKVKAEGKKTLIEVVYPKNARNISEGADLVIMAPRGSSLEAECISAPITVDGLTGEIEASNISGEVMIKGKCRRIDAETISGKLTVDGGAPEVSIQSISGLVSADGDEAEVEAQSVSGDIELTFAKFIQLSVESVSGSADIRGDLAKGGHFDFDLVSGNLTLALPGNVSADFRVETFSGDIENDFGGKVEKASKYAPGKSLEFTAGGGEARVRINTFSGDTSIVKK